MAQYDYVPPHMKVQPAERTTTEEPSFTPKPEPVVEPTITECPYCDWTTIKGANSLKAHLRAKHK